MTLTIQVPEDLERRLREQASRDGRAVEADALRLIERDAEGAGGGQAAPLSDDASESLLDDPAAGPAPPLPADFSRADIDAGRD